MSEQTQAEQPTAVHVLEYAALRGIAALLRAMPLSAASWLMGKTWRLFAPLTHRHRRTMFNLGLAMPELTRWERRQIAADQWENLGRVFAEGFNMDRIVADPERVTVDQPQILEEVTRRTRDCRGCVFVSLHMGNWEIIVAPLIGFYDVAGIYQRLKNPLAEQYVLSLRSELFAGGLYAKDPSTPAAVMRWVRDGNAVALLADHRQAGGEDATFFGQRTTATPFPAMLARRLGVPLIAARTVRTTGARFRIEVKEIRVPQTENAKQDVTEATQAIQDQFEIWIRDHPGQFMWIHDRWKDLRREAAQDRMMVVEDMS